MTETFTAPFGATELQFEIGKVAKQANGAVMGRWGDTMVLATCLMGPNYRNTDFFPLMVDYRDKMYAGGRIPGNFFRREGRPSDHEVLKCRLIDRPLRPLFPKGYNDEVQVYLNSYSVDLVNTDMLVAMNAASCALLISDIPFTTAVGSVQVGLVDGELTLNPTIQQMEESDLDLVVAGTAEALLMVESNANFVKEAVLLDALQFAHTHIKVLCEFQEEIRAKVGKEKVEFVAPEVDAAIVEKTNELSPKHLEPVYEIHEKSVHSAKLREAREGLLAEMLELLGEEEFAEHEETIKDAFKAQYKERVRRSTLDGVRIDGRKLDEVRAIDIEIGLLPRAHGSALFTRGQTQSLGTCTLGTQENQFLVDDIRGKYDKAYYLHYNFPCWSVGEVKPPRGPGRREIGHGFLAEKTIRPALPDHDDFPYTIRLVSEILESNGSSSMASVCSCSLALMDCGVPVKHPVAGIAMGLVKEGDEVVVLSDISGTEDHIGDMDFKVAGSADGVTALQMDIKIAGVTFEILEQALAQALVGRRHILDEMAKALPEARPELSRWAPRITRLQIDPERIGDLIGPQGKHIKEIVELTGVKIDVEDDGSVYIATSEAAAADEAVKLVKARTATAELHKIYTGKVVRSADFGIFVQILPNKDGLVHISEMTLDRLGDVGDLCREGDMITAKVTEIDKATGKVRLSRKAALEELGELPDEILNPEEPGARQARERGRGGGRGGPRGGGGGRRR